MVSSSHAICAQGLYIATISTLVETDEPEQEIQPAINLLGEILEIFVSVTQLFDPLEDGKQSNLWITKSYDPSSHFEMASQDILDIYEKIIGEKLDMNIEPDDDDEYWDGLWREFAVKTEEKYVKLWMLFLPFKMT